MLCCIHYVVLVKQERHVHKKTKTKSEVFDLKLVMKVHSSSMWGGGGGILNMYTCCMCVHDTSYLQLPTAYFI